MKIRLNGREMDVQAGMTIGGLLAQRALDPNKIVVEYNRQILKSDQWDATVLKDNDALEVLSFVGGG